MYVCIQQHVNVKLINLFHFLCFLHVEKKPSPSSYLMLSKLNDKGSKLNRAEQPRLLTLYRNYGNC